MRITLSLLTAFAAFTSIVVASAFPPAAARRIGARGNDSPVQDVAFTTPPPRRRDVTQIPLPYYCSMSPINPAICTVTGTNFDCSTEKPICTPPPGCAFSATATSCWYGTAPPCSTAFAWPTPYCASSLTSTSVGTWGYKQRRQNTVNQGEDPAVPFPNDLPQSTPTPTSSTSSSMNSNLPPSSTSAAPSPTASCWYRRESIEGQFEVKMYNWPDVNYGTGLLDNLRGECGVVTIWSAKPEYRWTPNVWVARGWIPLTAPNGCVEKAIWDASKIENVLCGEFTG